MAKQKTQKASELILDFTIYPRSMVVDHHVNELAEAIRAETGLPPVVVEQNTLRIVDGFHRVRAYQQIYGLDALVPVDLRSYPSDQELFLDSIRLNAGHGRRLTSYDIAHCLQIAEGLHLDTAALTGPLSVTMDHLAKIRQTKTAIGPGGVAIPIRRSVVHLAGTQLTKTQHEGAVSMGGMPILYYVNQVITAFEHSLLPTDHPLLFDRLRQLEILIHTWEEKKAA